MYEKCLHKIFYIGVFCWVSLFAFIKVWALEPINIHSHQRELPRFASLRSSEVNVRRGPGRQYPSDWIYSCSGMPIKIIAEYGTWRKIADYEGAGGWVHQAMLSGRRTVIISVDSAPLYKTADYHDLQRIAMLEKNVIGKVVQCKHQRCKIIVDHYKGWIQRTDIWGVKTEEEKFK